MPPPRKPTDVSAAQKERNEYIPSFISKKPFYVADDSTADSDYLEHQRLQSSAEQADRLQSSEQKWYNRGKRAGPAATKYRKGACENCGAMTHKTKDCLSRPRKQGARWTGADIEADEVIQDVNLGWDAKRDRWNGYDASQHSVLTEHTSENQGGELAQMDGAPNDEDEGARYEEETDMGRQQSTSTRNLRIREDTAKYLLNLDLDSAKYDPKTRSMVDSGATQDQAAALVAEEGFLKASGDAADFERAQRYAWESQERGGNDRVHLQANPTAGAFLQKKQREEDETKRETQRKALLDKYGGQEKFQTRSSDIAVIESEKYVEYDERGRIKNQAPVKVKSQYAEDVLINNHTTVWGSWWRDFKWGYACCHSMVKKSYCTGEQGKKALEEENQLEKAEDDVEVPKQIAWSEEASHEKHVPNGTEDDARTRLDIQSRKRAADDMGDDAMDAAHEEYRRKRVAADDPMANHVERNQLLA